MNHLPISYSFPLPQFSNCPSQQILPTHHSHQTPHLVPSHSRPVHQSQWDFIWHSSILLWTISFISRNPSIWRKQRNWHQSMLSYSLWHPEEGNLQWFPPFTILWNQTIGMSQQRRLDQHQTTLYGLAFFPSYCPYHLTICYISKKITPIKSLNHG
jgi:hypothetical protein